MKKIFSAALALVCIWFATPAFADLDPCRNLFDGVWQSGIYSTTTGVYSSAENRVSNKNMIAVQPDTKYVASGDGVDSIRWLFYDSNKAFIRAVNGNRTITTPNGTKYINIYIAADYTVETAPRFQIEQGDTATDYVPYNPTCWGIKIATTKYNESAFSPLNTALQNAISVVDTVVSNTITQAGRIATLQTQKQTRPADDPSDANNAENCPAGKKCLLVEDASGIPHWYEIVEKYSRLPDGYTELEYIESTGTQYIDTGIYGTEHHGMEIKFNFPTLSSTYSGRLCGGRTGTGAANAFAYIGTNLGTQAPTNNTFYVSSNNVLIADLEPVDTNVHTVSVNLSNNQKSYFDGQEIQGIGKTTAYVHQFTTNLFRAYNGSSGWADPTPARIYFCKITNSGELVRDFVPALNPDGKIGMYDTVNGVFYENKGTGEFIGGQPVFN